ncbi:sulfoquinovosidase-like [Babylonia areolata]|uniref:sulfoquinovosidase-like n=1 Tax=Babylonia areolata TaxID=304850 RepID=UPI003FD1CFFA
MSFRQVLRHNDTSPMLFVGEGSDQVEEFSGNFFITKYTEQRIALTSFKKTALGDGFFFNLSFADYWVNLRLNSVGETPLVVSIESSSNNFNRLWLRVPALPDERVFGGGEQFTYLNLRGRVFPVWTREQGVGRNKSSLTTFMADQLGRAGGDYHTTYYPQPTWLTSRKYFLHYTGSNYAEMDFRHQDFLEMLVEGDTRPAAWHFQVQSSLSSLVSCLSGLLGRVRPLPTWLYEGAILGVQGGTQQMLARLEEANASGVAVKGLWIQDWSGARATPFGSRVFWNWQWDPTHYPGLNTTIQTLQERGVRVLAYINPNLDSRGDLFATARAQGYLVRDATGDPYLVSFGSFRCGMVDFTNPAAYTWYKDDVIKGNMLKLGLGGWMADFGEYLPVDSVLHSGDPNLLHNQWPRLWARLNMQAISEMGADAADVVFFSRSGFSGSSNVSMLTWAGDQNVDWSLSDGAASTVPAALSLGLSGMGVTHFDIGGYTSYVLPSFRMVRSAERLLRSAEHAVFGPVFRTHEGNIPRVNAQFYSSPYMLQCFKRLVDMFVTLKQYHQHVNNVTVTTGLPALRPLFLDYPDDDNSYEIEYQYLYGDDLLVAPVYLPNQTTWSVYLPPSAAGSSWLYLWNATLASTGGQKVAVPTLVGQPPVFFRNDSAFVGTFRKIGKMELPSQCCVVKLGKGTGPREG